MEGFRRELKERALRALREGVKGVDLERALREFEETRSEVWRELEKKYRERGLI
ncbi:hypothetical protein [Thermofilum pendens]|uniref:Uncharacterized protein n=1 Tax=Thermofilum pendens (strain DSM 2475 / Hrk 5) TaxID=368408 RepID=A1S1D5_THEPD|nr:hypothetical protein [Thermofilum pendens]ABL79265.1 hypothetical protein Tpen_1870 [Thermofilum pendens Hrk 5]